MSAVPHIDSPFCVCDRCRPDLAAADEQRVTEGQEDQQ